VVKILSDGGVKMEYCKYETLIGVGWGAEVMVVTARYTGRMEVK
jgi:hypothetical protein